MDLNEKIAARRRELAASPSQQLQKSDEKAAASFSETYKQNTGQDTETQQGTTTSINESDEEFNRTITQRITCKRSEEEIKAVVGNHFHKMEPEFDATTLRYSDIAKISVGKVAEYEWIITVDFDEEEESTLRNAYFVLGAIFLYNLFVGNLGIVFLIIICVFAVGFIRRNYPDKFTSANVRARLMNIKDELQGT